MDCKVPSVKSPNGNSIFRQIATPTAEMLKSHFEKTIESKFPFNFMTSYDFWTPNQFKISLSIIPKFRRL